MNKKVIEIAILVVLGMLMVFIMVATNGKGIRAENYTDLKENWTISVNEKLYYTDDIAEQDFAITNKGDKLVLETIIPEHNILMPQLQFFFIHSVVDIYLDEECIYTYGHELYEQGKVLGYGYHYILLPDENIGKKLRVELMVTEDEAFTSIDLPKIYNASTVISDYLHENRIPLLLSCFLMIFGLGAAVVSAVGIWAQKAFLKPLCVGLFSFCVGVWSFANYNLLFVFTDNLLMKVYLEYGALYLAPLWILIYFRNEGLYQGTKIQKIGYFVLEIAQFCFTMFAFVGQISGKIHFPAVLGIQHVLILLFILYLLNIFLVEFVHKNYENIILLLGLAIMIFFAMFDLIRFYLEKYIPSMGRGEYRGFLCVGAVLFVMAMMINYANEISEALYQSAEQAALQRLAYIDALTGLSNRRDCEEKLDELDEKKTNYGIIEFDLNNLKKVNDELGHEEGDRFIKAFSMILHMVFSEVGLVSRIGGDEFTVIIDDVTQIDLDSLFVKLKELLQKINTSNQNWNMSTAYGICTYSKDKIYPSRQALKLADERMYANKIEMKKG